MSESNIPRKSNVTRIGRARRQMSALASGERCPAGEGRGRPFLHRPGLRPPRPLSSSTRPHPLQRLLPKSSSTKTQVFVTHEGDLYRTRMTHTIEVMQIARSIAGMLGLERDARRGHRPGARHRAPPVRARR